MYRILLILLLGLVLVSCKNEVNQSKFQADNYFEQVGNRQIAEWEPAKGVYFVWPPVIPKELIIALSQDTHIYPLVDGAEGRANAEEWFEKWNIDLNKVRFINLKTRGEVTPRDWGPSALFTKKGAFKLIDGLYKNACPASGFGCNDSLEFNVLNNGELYKSTVVDTAITALGKQLGMEVLEVPVINTGGNVMTDGLGTAFSTCILLNENRYNGISDDEFFKWNDSLLGFTNYHIISNFDHIGIQHIDCLLKLIDEETILVAEPPKEHDLFKIYEDIVDNELSQLKTIYNRPFTIKRIKTAPYYQDQNAAYLAAYTNSIIVNKNIYVPLFGIPEDSLALKTWESVMPGYTVKGFEYVLAEQPIKSPFHFQGFEEIGVTTGWLYEDAIHCRVKAVWEEDMTLITVKKILSDVHFNQEADLHATVIDYGNWGFPAENVFLNWRKKGEANWGKIPMQLEKNPHHWRIGFPRQDTETTIEYFVEVTSKSGRTATKPNTAPKGFYSFNYVAE